ncbi:hypothetical protein LguiA_021065 [Lonicera macranthoides]
MGLQGSPNFRCGMSPLSYHSSTQGSTHRSSYHSSTQGNSGRIASKVVMQIPLTQLVYPMCKKSTLYSLLLSLELRDLFQIRDLREEKAGGANWLELIQVDRLLRMQ